MNDVPGHEKSILIWIVVVAGLGMSITAWLFRTDSVCGLHAAAGGVLGVALASLFCELVWRSVRRMANRSQQLFAGVGQAFCLQPAGSECRLQAFAGETSGTDVVAVQEPQVFEEQENGNCTNEEGDISQLLRTVIHGHAELADAEKMDCTSRPSKRGTLELTDLVTGALRRLETTIASSIQITCLFARDALYVQGNPDTLNRLFSVLCSKACQAMPEEGVLTITTKREWLDEAVCPPGGSQKAGFYAVLGVADTGSATRLGGGECPSGLTLGTLPLGEAAVEWFADVERIVNCHGGLLRVCPSCEMGLSICVYLPLEPENHAGYGLCDTRFEGDETILLAEDDDAVRLLTARFLGKAGYQVLEATNGIEAIQTLHDAGGKVDCLVFDLVMPKMGGLEAYDKIKEEWPDIPVVFVSAFSEQALNMHLGLVDGVNFVRKPFEARLLLQVVRQCLR